MAVSPTAARNAGAHGPCRAASRHRQPTGRVRSSHTRPSPGPCRAGMRPHPSARRSYPYVEFRAPAAPVAGCVPLPSPWATAALLALGATAALAHDPLATANAYVPANGSVVDGALPATILVNFQDTFRQAGNAADPSVPVARVLDAAGTDHVATAVQNPNNAKQLVITTKNRTTPGKYTVTWTITASDGHAVSNDGSDVSEEGSPLVFTVHTSASAAAKASRTPRRRPRPP